MDAATILKQLEQQEDRDKKAATTRWESMSEAERAKHRQATRNLADKMQSSV